MSDSGKFYKIPAIFESSFRPLEDVLRQAPVAGADPRVPLLNLSTVRSRMDSLQRFLSDSVTSNSLIGKDQMEMVSTEIASAIHQIIVNGAALLACNHRPSVPPQFEETAQNPPQTTNPSLITGFASDPRFSDDSGDVELKTTIATMNSIGTRNDKGEVEMKVEEEEMKDETPSDDWEIIELDAVELLAEHIHFCDICGKGFKRDANLRMHMRAHGNQFKTLEALAKPERFSSESSGRKRRFSCPFVGCNRNKLHKKFRPLKSAICVKNHFKRSHCPKMYSCNRCNKKSFSVVADLKSHLKHCGESKWKCSCGTTFSRKDKLFGHMALFEGHMPAVADDDEKAKGAAAAATAMATAMIAENEEDEDRMMETETGANIANNGFSEGLLDEFGLIDGYCLQDLLGSPTGLSSTMNVFCNF